MRECAGPALLGRDKPNKNGADVKGLKEVVEVTVGEQQGRRVKHESGEAKMDRHDMHTANTFLCGLDPYVCVFTRMRSAECAVLCGKNVRATAKVCTSGAMCADSRHHADLFALLLAPLRSVLQPPRASPLVCAYSVHLCLLLPEISHCSLLIASLQLPDRFTAAS